MHRADNVRPSGPSNDRGEQQRQRLRAECRPCQESYFAGSNESSAGAQVITLSMVRWCFSE